MKHPDPYRSCFILAVLTFIISTSSFAQSKIKDFKDSTGFIAYMVNNRDTIAINCDSTFLINKTSFNIYKTYRAKVNAANSSFKDLVTVYEGIIHKQDTMLKAKDEYYKVLGEKFDSLSGKTHVFLDQTEDKIQVASTSLNSATIKLEATQKLLEQTKKLLEGERRRMNSKAMKFGIAGVVLGGLIAAVIIH